MATKKPALILLILLCLLPLSAFAGPRDAIAILNRCGKPLKGDETVLDNSGGHRTFKYERGTILFERIGNDGWSFVSGEHKKVKDLDASQMAMFMPCITPALQDSAAAEPIKPITPVERVEVSVKHDYKQVVLFTILGLVVLGLVFFLLSRRKPSEED